MSARLATLRSVAPSALPLYQAERALRGAGWQVTLRTEAPPPGYVGLRAVWSSRTYEGWVSLDDLARRAFPMLGDIAWHAADKRYVFDLLEQGGQILALPAPPDGWSHVRFTQIVEAPLPPEPLLCFDEPGGVQAYFRQFPEAVAPLGAALAHIGALPVAVQFVFGRTTVPRSLISHIAPGDAIRINRLRNEVRVGGLTVCDFHCEGSNIMLSEQNQMATDDDIDGGQSRPAAGDGQATELFNPDELPITLEFVLQEEQVSVGQLVGCHVGMVLPMRPNASSDVIIRANGRRIGNGEVIQVGEHLAVEVKTLWATQT